MKAKIVNLLALAGAVMFLGAGCNTTPPNPGESPSEPSAVPSQSAMPVIDGGNQQPVVEMVVNETEDSEVGKKEFVITAKSWEFSPGTITVKKGDKVKLSITSADIEHGFSLRDYNIDVKLPPNQTQIIEFTADKAGAFTFRCNVPCGEGHREMTGKLVVTE